MAERGALLADDDGVGNMGSGVDSSDEEECGDLEPFFFDEAVAVAEHAAAEEKRRKKEQEEAREKERIEQRWQAHLSALDRIREFNPKLNCFYFTRFYMADLSKLDLDEESPLGPMRYTDTYMEISTNRYGTICNQGGSWFKPTDSANFLSVKIVSSSVGFPVNVYGTLIARDSLDHKCVYLFRCNRDHCQLIISVDEPLLLTGPKRGLALTSSIIFEADLKIKGDQDQDDKEFSKGFLKLDGIPRRTWDKMVVESDSLDTKLSTVEVTFAVVKRAVEATIAVEVLHGEFNGNITAHTTSIQNSLLLFDSEVAGAWIGDRKGIIQLLRPVIAVSLQDMLTVNIVGVTEQATLEFKPAVNGGDKAEIGCGSCLMAVKITWSIIDQEYLGTRR
ncbi:hypothetical protein EJB05_34429, partial [Eragrostis curvula]